MSGARGGRALGGEGAAGRALGAGGRPGSDDDSAPAYSLPRRAAMGSRLDAFQA